jgi:hypothetical protein
MLIDMSRMACMKIGKCFQEFHLDVMLRKGRGGGDYRAVKKTHQQRKARALNSRKGMAIEVMYIAHII